NADGTNPTPITLNSNVSNLSQSGVGFVRLNVEPSWQTANGLTPTPAPTPSPSPVPPANYEAAQIATDQASLDVFTFGNRAYVIVKLTF
ncbi:MAG: hypothetical protein ABR577_20235, partial [Pyrinomonadaceae bacterium]